MKYYKVYIDYNSYSKEMKVAFWKEMLKISDAFSIRFVYPFSNVYTDSMKVFFANNPELEYGCESNIIDKFNSKKYYDYLDSITATVYVCRNFDLFFDYIFENLDIFEWKEGECPQDLCLLCNGKLVMYSCFHEEELMLYLCEKDTIGLLNSHLIKPYHLIDIDESEIPGLNRNMR